MTFQEQATQASSTDDGQADDTKQFERKSELVAVFVEMMEPTLKPHGFKFVKSKHAFVKTYPQIEQHLSFEMLEYYPNFRVSMYATVYAKLKPCEFADKASDASLLRGGGGAPIKFICSSTLKRFTSCVGNAQTMGS